MSDLKTYEYSVRDTKGALVKGKLEGPSQDAVVATLIQKGYAPISVAEAGQGMNREISFGTPKVGLKDLAIASRQFATMINAGLSLLRALTILSEQTSNTTLAKTFSVIRGQVQEGSSLSSAMAKQPNIFPPLMINMCRAGEVGGFLDTTLLQIADGFEADVKLRSKVKSAMTYPVAVLVIAVLAVIGMLTFIVPVFKDMFDQLGGQLPLPTKVLVFLSEQMTWFVPVLIVSTVVFFTVWGRYKHEPAVRNVVDPLKLKMPVFGSVFQKVAISRFSRNLGAMTSAGVPILQALDIVAETTGNVMVTRAVHDVQNSVRSGESMAGPLAQHPVFPPMVVQLLSVGEDTGAIDTMLSKVAEFYDAEVEATADALTSLMEPILIAFLGSIVGSMIIALYLPIFKIFELIK